MKIKFTCYSCEGSSEPEIEDICRIWEKQYIEEKEALGEDFGLYVQAECPSCGTINVYDSPLFKHIFRIMFDEYLANQ